MFENVHRNYKCSRSQLIHSKFNSLISDFFKAIGSKIGLLIQSVSTVVCAIIIAFCSNWKLGIFTIVILPFILGAAYAESRITQNDDSEEEMMESGRVK